MARTRETTARAAEAGPAPRPYANDQRQGACAERMAGETAGRLVGAVSNRRCGIPMETFPLSNRLAQKDEPPVQADRNP